MPIVIGTLSLVFPGGTESYCLTVARELDRLGHSVTLFADELGPLADHAAETGFDIVRGVAEPRRMRRGARERRDHRRIAR